MISYFIKKRACNLNECIEQIFFKVIIVAALIGCFTVLVFDMFLTRQSYNVYVVVLFILILFSTLYSINKIDFGITATACIIMMCITITYRGILSNDYNEITCTLLITLGFISSLVTRGMISYFLKLMIIISLFIVLFKDYKSVSYVILVRKAIPYVVIYFIVTICSGFLKERYERNQARLREFVALLHQKNQKINEQHALLQANFRELSHLNENLESIIAEKTRRIAEKNKQLASIAYAHAHQVRGPLARILGLLNLVTLEPDKKDFYVCKIGEQALEMDETLSSVTKSIEGNIHK